MALHTFQGQGGDVNTVQFLPDGHHFGRGSDDGVCHFWAHMSYSTTLTACHLNGPFQCHLYCFLQFWTSPVCGLYQCQLLHLGHLLAEVITNLGGGMGEGHCSWVSCLGMASDGSAVCTGSWDTSLKVWAYAGNRKIIWRL